MTWNNLFHMVWPCRNMRADAGTNQFVVLPTSCSPLAVRLFCIESERQVLFLSSYCLAVFDLEPKFTHTQRGICNMQRIIRNIENIVESIFSIFRYLVLGVAFVLLDIIQHELNRKKKISIKNCIRLQIWIDRLIFYMTALLLKLTTFYWQTN